MRPLILAILMAQTLLLSADGAAQSSRPVVVLLDIIGPIGPATADYIHRSLAKAEDRSAAAVILQIDTPGGLDSSMREIIQDILATPIPVISYVSPQGARAASAGTYILYASHIAAMAPATNLGAATPIQIGGLPKPPNPAPMPKETEQEKNKNTNPHPTLADKAISDAVAYIRGLAQMRGRNAIWAEKAVREAASLSAEEALHSNVIDLIARDLNDLLTTVDGLEVRVLDELKILSLKDADVVIMEPDWRTNLLALITNPNLVYIFMLAGFYGLIFEFTHPGAVLPGVVGAICIVLALFALHILPINYAGLGLILLGLAFMVSEAFLPSFGALGIGGVIAFVIGSVMMLDTDVPGYGVDWVLIAGVGGISGSFFVLVLALAVKARKKPVVSGREELIGSPGQVTEWDNREGRITVRGELWQATAEQPFSPGEEVRITKIEGLVLAVEPASPSGAKP